MIMKRLIFFALLLFTVHCSLFTVDAQTLTGTAPVRWVATLPATCVITDKTRVLVYKFGSNAGVYYCSSANTWTKITAQTVDTGLFGNGDASAPSIGFTSDTDTGLFRSAANAIGFGTGGTERWTLNASGHFVPFSSRAYDIGTSSLLARDLYVGRQLFATQGTLTTSSQPYINHTATWNDGAVVFTGFKSNITDTASDAGSLLMDLQVGGSSKFSVSKLGVVTAMKGFTVMSGGITTNDPTTGLGYGSGSGGAVTQSTSKSTAVTSNTVTTAITLNNAALNAGSAVSFTFTNSAIAATDTVLCTHESAGTSAAYVCNAFPGSGSAVVTVRNVTAGNLSEAIVLRITVIKSVSS
jgi:hypothetical protein